MSEAVLATQHTATVASRVIVILLDEASVDRYELALRLEVSRGTVSRAVRYIRDRFGLELPVKHGPRRRRQTPGLGKGTYRLSPRDRLKVERACALTVEEVSQQLGGSPIIGLALEALP